MREKRYSNGMKGTQGKKEEREGERGNKGSFCRRCGRKELKRGDYTTLFTIEGKLII